MTEAVCDIWTERVHADAVCVTTNGDVNSKGRAVMGRGVAKQASLMFPHVARKLAQLLQGNGNHVHILIYERTLVLVSFPVKHHYWEEADVALIAQSAHELMQLTNMMGWKRVLLPRPGCGNGGLTWAQVRPVIEKICDDRICVVTEK